MVIFSYKKSYEVKISKFTFNTSPKNGVYLYYRARGAKHGQHLVIQKLY